jgi:ATP-dependent Clp protease, protease subunit
MFRKERTIRWFGDVNQENLLKTQDLIIGMLAEDTQTPIDLLITTSGGHFAIGFTFYDWIKQVVRPPLRTLALGKVDSLGILLFMTGNSRIIAPNCTMSLHNFTRTFKKVSLHASQLLKIGYAIKNEEERYARVLAEHSGNKLMPQEVLDMMRQETVLLSEQAVERGIAQAILQLSPLDD